LICLEKGNDMNKATPASEPNIWDDAPKEAPAKKEKIEKVVAKPAATVTTVPQTPDYDLEGLQTDFPTATDLERFVFDETGVVLSLKGRANKMKYQVAMDVLNGQPVDPKFIGEGNPYLDKADMVPEEPMKTLPPRSPEIPPLTDLQNEFFTAFVPHSDPEYHARGVKMHCTFRKYKNGCITYEVLGPIEPKPFGEKIDKFGRMRPEIIKWTDPRTGEQIVQREDGTLTPIGRRLKAMMQTMKYNDSNQWIRYIDRDFISLDQRAAQNPWDLAEK
jgi:hypothetical protein